MIKNPATNSPVLGKHNGEIVVLFDKLQLFI